MQPTDPSKFTEQAWDAIVKSQDVARRYQNQQLEVEHLIIALLEQQGTANKILNRVGIEPENLLQQIDSFAKRQPKVGSIEHLYLGRSLEIFLDLADEAREKWEDKFIAVEHLLLAFYQDKRLGNKLLSGGTPQLPTRPGFERPQTSPKVEFEQLEAAIKAVRGSTKVEDQNPEASYDALAKYGRDLTELAKAGKLDPVIGRDEEIRRVVSCLSRRTKNNPVLIGEPGVGKTAIAEGLAQRIVNGDVPESLKERQLIGLDMGSLIAGAKFRGEFEERLRSVLREVTNSDGQIVLFIDELHTVVGAGSSGGTGSGVDAGNLLKPMLARGELRCIGATTIDEYRKHIEKDAALERRFQKVEVGQPSVEDTISILRGLKDRYETHHGVKITDAALVSAATLSNRYISDRFLPDKAIDLVDEAAAQLKMEITSKPEELEAIDRRIMQLEMEKLSIEGELQSSKKDQNSEPTPPVKVSPALQRITNEINVLKQKQEKFSSKWSGEKELLNTINSLKAEEDKLKVQIEQAERAYDLNTAAQLKYGQLETVHRDREAKEAELLKVQAQGSSLLREQVTDADIATIVAKWTGIPVNRLLESERQKLLQLEKHLHQRVIGQSEAVEAVAAAIRRARAGMKDPGRPIGSFMFLGPTGVGKTELARALAQFLFDRDDALVRIDMSEYMEKHAVSRLVGAPPGYVGYDQGGQLSEAVRRHPYSVLLFDEVEKAHPDVFNILLQVLDDGRITDSQGRVVDFSSTVIVMTSNIGGEYILDVAGDDSKYEEMYKRVMGGLRKHFRPEFLNRVDEIILFHTLRKSELRQIVEIQVKRIERLLGEQKISLKLTPATLDHIAEVGYDPVYGARPLKRAIQKELENPLANLILENKFVGGDVVVIDCVDSGLVFGKKDELELVKS
ncbi:MULTISPECIES: ATP-dependent chaperone ClpB [unclassified Okeania]|uniref:ATP-dependent chaperone ClpB n=1 Tax=unclassified Okeania TaxID=2634635 RepID=UPI0013BDC186|nr:MULTISPECIES: ATP-dependent chaperone ClpB [unclassified Okeania]NES77076.1 ATP-dependent chaperone ClpB [Okeania sp. SIO1H4]NET14248.1 ATP-dependent chaperone ClpB [Okeania sp. SIO1H6]NET21390.1 ATP-dependent chaperone ClpB [Okeania sp. SIO1H5]NET93946.1 ATP-dependent chaperone ClpB [Okeania sp. SIO1H2]